MNNQKDTQKTGINAYGQADFYADKALVHKPVYEFANKKTEKLITALYMVTDCMDTDDALKNKLRGLGVELLSDMYKLSTLIPVEKHSHIDVSLAHIYEILSFIEIAHTIGFISEMNGMILKKEFTILVEELESHKSKDKHFTFTLNEKMFEVPKESQKEVSIYDKDNSVKDIKRTSFNTMSFTNQRSPLSNFEPKTHNHNVANLDDREDRTAKIISLIKDTKFGTNGVSIKDISLAFTDISEKTIQRELNTLVSKGKLTKTGSKRWSRYQAV
jgi:hypothetical protein